MLILVQRTFTSIGTLRKVAGIVCMIGAGRAEIFLVDRPIKWNARMTKGFECGSTLGADDRLRINRMTTTGTIRHQQQEKSHYLFILAQPHLLYSLGG